MFDVGQKLLYKAFGLTVSSDIHFPELTVLSDRLESIDVEIKIEDVTKLYFELSEEPNKFVVKENLVLFQISDIATFAIREGKVILVSPMKESDEDEIRLLILGTCMGAILMQRRIYPLHGSAVAINGKAYAFIGDSGAGKSTLASAFLNEGFQLLSDDVIAVSFTKDGNHPFVTPSYPQQKLWQDTLNNFGMETSHYRSVFGRVAKFSVPIPSKYCTAPLLLAGIFELVKTDDQKIGIARIEKLKRLQTLFSHTYRNFLIQGLELLDWHFHASAGILNQIDMFQLRRPATGFSAPQLVSSIMTTINWRKES